MSMTDPIADMLTRVRNACQAKHPRVDVPSSKLKREVARVLAESRFIDNFAYIEDNKQGVFGSIYAMIRETKALFTGSSASVDQDCGNIQATRILNAFYVAWALPSFQPLKG